MPYFLSDKNLNIDQQVILAGEEAGHILLSHRVKKGEKINSKGRTENGFWPRLLRQQKRCYRKSFRNPGYSQRAGNFYYPLPVRSLRKSFGFYFPKRHGAGPKSKIVLFNSANTAAKLSKELFVKKSARWNKILMEAAKQSERAKVPALEFSGDVQRID